MHLAASDSHVVLVSASPQILYGDVDSVGDRIVHVLGVDEAGMPKGKWRKLPPRRRMGSISFLAHEGGLWHLLGPKEHSWQGGDGRGRGGERMRCRWDRQIASFDPYTRQWIEADEKADEEEVEEEEDFDPSLEAGMMHGGRHADAALDGGDTSESNSRGVVDVDCGEGPRGCHKQLLLQAAAVYDALSRRPAYVVLSYGRISMRRDLLVLQGEELQSEMRRLFTRGPEPFAVDVGGQ